MGDADIDSESLSGSALSVVLPGELYAIKKLGSLSALIALERLRNLRCR